MPPRSYKGRFVFRSLTSARVSKEVGLDVLHPSVPGLINSHYFRIGDGKLNPIVGVYRAPL